MRQKKAWFFDSHSPTMSMLMLQSVRSMMSRLALTHWPMPENSGPQMKRMVRFGRGRRPSAIRVLRTRATSRMQALPEMLSLAPCFCEALEEVGGEDDLARGRVRAGDVADDVLEVGRLHLRLDLGPDGDLLVGQEPALEDVAFADRELEGEALGLRGPGLGGRGRGLGRLAGGGRSRAVRARPRRACGAA